MNRAILFLLLVLVFYSCKQEECTIDCNSTKLGDFFLNDSIIDSIPYGANTPNLSFSNQFNQTIEYSLVDNGLFQVKILIEQLFQSCPGSGFGANKKEKESKVCIIYYNSEGYSVRLRSSNDSICPEFMIFAHKNFTGDYIGKDFPPQDSLHDVLQLSLGSKYYYTSSGTIYFNNLGSSFAHSIATLLPVDTLNGKAYTNVYKIALDTTYFPSGIITMYYNTSLGLLGFSKTNGENWFLNE